MKKIFSIILSICMLISTGSVFAVDNLSASVEKGFTSTKIKFTPSDKIAKIKGVDVVRKGENISFEKTERERDLTGQKKYYMSSNFLGLSKLTDGDVVVVKFGDGENDKKAFVYHTEVSSDDTIAPVSMQDAEIDKDASESEYNIKLSLPTGSKFSFLSKKILVTPMIQDTNKVYFNNKLLNKVTNNSSVSQDTYYAEADGISVSNLSDRDKIEFKDANDKTIGVFRYISSGKIFKPIKSKESSQTSEKDDSENSNTGSDSSTEKDNSGKGDSNDNIGKTDNNASGNVEKITSIKEERSGFDNYLVITPKEKLNDVAEFYVGETMYKASDRKITVSGNIYYKDVNEGKLYLSNSVSTNSRLKFKDSKGNIIGAFVKKSNGEFETIASKDSIEKELKVKIAGTFEAAIVGQKKYDAISGATGTVTQTTNSKVNIYVQEVNKGKQPVESEWKLVKDTNISLVKGTKINGSKGIITGEGSGMKVGYNPFKSALILQGTPDKEGDYKVSIHVLDNYGRTAVSNELPFKIYNLNKTKLIDQLKESNFSKLTYGDVWDMEPWDIHTFGGDNETVTVPKKLNVWFGSHESGTYGYLGRAKRKGVEPIKQTLIVDKDTDLTLENMQILSSVNVVVKKGAKLNIKDSSIYGTITVEEGGTLQVNYDEHSKKFTTGSSINGKIVLKDGVILENSAIYSNANSLTDGDEAKKITTPVVEAEGNVTIKGKVFIRGDESPTGTDPDTKVEYKGQPALKVKNGKLNISKDSTLALYGGGVKSTTTNGGDALILEGGTVEGEGYLVAVGGNAGGLGPNSKGGSAVSGNGNLNVSKAYLLGGYSNGDKEENYGVPYTSDVKISENTIGKAEKGKSIKSIKNNAIQPEYWSDITKAPGSGLENDPLEFTKISDEKKTVEKTDKTDPGKKDHSEEDNNAKKVSTPSSFGATVASEEKNSKKITRISGDDRVKTSVEISKKNFNNSKTVIIATKDMYPDSLSAGVLAKSLKSPILLTGKNMLSKEVKDEIKRLGATEIIIVGGENSVGSSIQNELKMSNLSVERIGGIDRYETSSLIAKKISKIANIGEKAIVASGETFADALAISPMAARDNMPILLVNKNKITKEVKETLNELKITKVYVVGGYSTVGKELESNLPTIVERISGSDRYETSSKIASYSYKEAKSAYIASGEIFADALVAGPVASNADAPMLLVKRNDATKYTKDYVKNSKIDNLIILGGTSSVSDSVVDQLK